MAVAQCAALDRRLASSQAAAALHLVSAVNKHWPDNPLLTGQHCAVRPLHTSVDKVCADTCPAA